MNEPKTLKDLKSDFLVVRMNAIKKSIPKEDIDIIQNWIDNRVIDKKTLRDEAIKWIKKIEEELQPLPDINVIGGTRFKKPQKTLLIFNNSEIQCTDEEVSKIKVVWISWIKYFFQITDKKRCDVG